MFDGFESYEQGPIRPPSESGSLLIRVSRNCPWNRCLFCPVYKLDRFSRRTAEEIKKDIDVIAGSVEKIREISFQQGYGGSVNREILQQVYHNAPEMLVLANWLYRGERTVFLQDADSLVYSTDMLHEIISYLNDKIPGISRITTYARAKSLTKKSAGDLKMLKNAGLTRIHVGLESGSDRVLEYMKKGVTAAEHVDAGRKTKEAGITLSEYVILGLGGQEYRHEHAVETADVLNRINPDFIRVRTLVIHPVSPLMEEWQAGKFIPLSDEDILKEEKLFIENLDNIKSEFYSDHILNLLEEVQGVLPEAKGAMLSVINDYFSLSTGERELFRLGRRSGLFRRLADLREHYLRSRVGELYKDIRDRGLTVDEYIEDIRLNYL